MEKPTDKLIPRCDAAELHGLFRAQRCGVAASKTEGDKRCTVWNRPLNRRRELLQPCPSQDRDGLAGIDGADVYGVDEGVSISIAVK